MTPKHPTITRLEKAAMDNGFDLALGRQGDWLAFGSSQTRLRIWLSSLVDSFYVVALSRWDVYESLSGLGVPQKSPLPVGGPAGYSVHDMASLHRLVRRAFQVSRALPDEPLQVFSQRTARCRHRRKSSGWLSSGSARRSFGVA